MRMFALGAVAQVSFLPELQDAIECRPTRN
jgi:hypothetical protein